MNNRFKILLIVFVPIIAILYYQSLQQNESYEYYVSDWTKDDKQDFIMYFHNKIYFLFSESEQDIRTWERIHVSVNVIYEDDCIKLIINNNNTLTDYIITLKYDNITIHFDNDLIGYIPTNDCTINNCRIYKNNDSIVNITGKEDFRIYSKINLDYQLIYGITKLLKQFVGKNH
jgi:hypothetical protein